MVTDIPAGFDDWQWRPQAIEHWVSVTAFQLARPQQPDWRLINRWYPQCSEARVNNYWVCKINGKLWSFFEFQQQQWVLMPIKEAAVQQESPLNLGLDQVSMNEHNGYQVWVYFSRHSLGLLQRHLKMRLQQLIERISRLQEPGDLWYLRDGHGRLVFSQYGDWSFVTLLVEESP